MDIEQTTRDQRIPILLTQDEKQKIQLAAYRAGLKASTYVRMQILALIDG